jgi:tRNA U38,U39,U40 pseudouridine synthase TruA
MTEYTSMDPRYKRKTFAMRIGYDGASYNGYQSQKGTVGIRTVEEELFDALGGRTCCAAGRTDADVSAISQIISFNTYDDVTADSLLMDVRASEPVISGRLAAFECVRVPRRFHSLFGATWRRYLYVMPLNRGIYNGGVDVDVSFINTALSQLVERELPYNAFAYREDRSVDQGDLCTLYCARAFLIHLDSSTDSEGIRSFEPVPFGLCIELVGDRFLRRMVRILVVRILFYYYYFYICFY